MAKLRRNRRWKWAAGACASVLLAPCAGFGASSPWVGGLHSAARLISAGQARPGDELPQGTLLAGVEVRLDPNFITYWRNPGEAGMAPSLAFDRSENLKSVRVEFPAPAKLDEGGSQAFGYSGAVTFPLLVTAENPARPVRLELALDYAVCANICLPAKAHLSLDLDGAPSREAETVFAAMASVPQARQVGDPGAIRIDSVQPQADGSFTVDATTPDGTGSLFLEATEPWYLSASAGHPTGHGHLAFTVTAPDRPSGEMPSEPVRLTLVGPGGAIEVPVRLDGPAPKP